VVSLSDNDRDWLEVYCRAARLSVSGGMWHGGCGRATRLSVNDGACHGG
jgi:hypothetical protein